MTFLYAERTSVAPGEALRLRVATQAPRFTLALARSGASLERIPLASQAFETQGAPGAAEAEPARWPAYDVPLPGTLRSGVYLAYVVAEGSPNIALDARSGAALFVVRGPRRSPVLFNIPLFTYHAYCTGILDPARDDTRGACLYTGAEAVSLWRPGGGIGGRTWDEATLDVYDPESPRQTWAHWDAKALAWLEKAGIEPDVCTDLDLHDDAELLSGRRLLLCFGHHEYWSDAMRANVERFVASGGNVAFFGGNTLWFRVNFDPASRSIRHGGPWPQPESLLTGLTYRRGAGWWRGERSATGYTVGKAAHWIFEGTQLRDGDTFGAPQRLIGYECDGIAEPAATPPGLQELAFADVASWPIPPGAGDLFAGGRASLTIYEKGGTVVNAGTADWARLLASEPLVARITSNVVARLG